LIISTLTSADTLSLGSGTDTLRLSAAETIAVGDFAYVTGVEILDLADGSNEVMMGAAASVAGIRTVYGGTGADSINASGISSDMTIYPGSGADSIYLGAGNDLVSFGSGAESLSASDLISGGGGQDTIRITAADTLSDVDFTDVSSVEALLFDSGSNVLSLGTEAAQAGISIIGGGTGADSINATDYTLQLAVTGGNGDDWIFGSSASGGDWINAGSGNDWVNAAGGADTVYGGAGADSVEGGDGSDYLSLGAGADTVYLGDSSSGAYWTADTSGDGDGDLVLFDLSDIGSADSFSDVIFNFSVGSDALAGDSIGGYSGYNVADSLSSNPGWVEGGFLLNGSGADTVFADLPTAISVIESLGADSTKYDLDANEVFLFRVSTDAYIGTTNGQKVTSVVKLVGVGPDKASFDLIESSTDGIFYIGPSGG
jgi:Ca2+-binding RTX toxin-like protein